MITFGLFHSVAPDPDAKAFLQAAGINNTTIQIAIDHLVIDLKAASLWTKPKAIYPMVGGTAATCKYNLKDPRDADNAYRQTFYNNPTIDADGVQFNGVNQYVDTHLAPGTALSTRNITMVYYNLIDQSSGVDMGIYHLAPNRYDLWVGDGLGNMHLSASGPGGLVPSAKGTFNKSGLYLVTSDNTTIYPYRNGVALPNISRAVNTTPNTDTFYLGAENRVTVIGGPTLYSNSKCGFVMISEPLTPAEAVTMSGIINHFMTHMSKNTY